MPWLQAFELKKLSPLILIAGQPLTTRTTRMKASARAGSTAPAPPSQRMSWPFRIPARSPATTLRGAGRGPLPPQAAPRSNTVISQPVILAIWASDRVTTEAGSGWKFTDASCVVPLVTAQYKNAWMSCARVALDCEVFTMAYS